MKDTYDARRERAERRERNRQVKETRLAEYWSSKEPEPEWKPKTWVGRFWMTWRGVIAVGAIASLIYGGYRFTKYIELHPRSNDTTPIQFQWQGERAYPTLPTFSPANNSSNQKPDTEMSRKYREAVDKKQRLEKGEGGWGTTAEEVCAGLKGRSRKRECERSWREFERKLKPHRATR
jgi:hypothetical protein